MICSSTVSNDVAHSSCLKPIALPIWLAASSCCKRYSLTSYSLEMKSVYCQTTIQLAERSRLCTSQRQEATLIPAATHALNIQQVGFGARCCVNNGYDWTDIFWMGWRWTASITAMSCCLSKYFQQSNVSQGVVHSQNNMLVATKLVIFCVL